MTRNELYPIFLKPDSIRYLVIGGGEVAAEKLGFILKASSTAEVHVVAPDLNKKVGQLIVENRLSYTKAIYQCEHLADHQVIIAATSNRKVNEVIYSDARAANRLINVADNPDLCDFFLGGIVTKGNLKIAISTNGASPTLAKRLRQFFEDVLPEDIDELLVNLKKYRSTLKLDFKQKVAHLNELTKTLVDDDQHSNSHNIR